MTLSLVPLPALTVTMKMRGDTHQLLLQRTNHPIQYLIPSSATRTYHPNLVPGDNAPLFPRTQSIPTHKCWCMQAEPHACTHFTHLTAGTLFQSMLFSILAEAVAPHPFVSGSRKPCGLRNYPPRTPRPLWARKVARAESDLCVLWAGGQRRASHVQRQRAKPLCYRGDHELGGRLCPR